MKQICLFILLLISTVGFAQKEANIWYFGRNAGLDFNSGSPVALTDGLLSTGSGCATISDSSGNLLFYSDGRSIRNKNHSFMLNGESLNGNPDSTQTAIIVPKPGDINIYYVFTTGAEADSFGMQYSEVDMRLASGLGAVTSNKNIQLITPVTEKLTAVKSTGFNGYWVISHAWNSNDFIAYKVTAFGVDMSPVISSVGTHIGGDIRNARGQIKVSPNGERIAAAHEGELNQLQLFDFNASNGQVSNPLTIVDEESDKTIYGVEFSPNNNVLYVSGMYHGVFQYDLQVYTQAAIIASKYVITNLSLRTFASMQLATDGKIYIARNGYYYLDYISNPDVVGFGYDYHSDGVYLEGNRSTHGLPPFIQSFFAVGFNYEEQCTGIATQFTSNSSQAFDSMSWDFGDGNTSTLENPPHMYSLPGNYTVQLTVTSGSETSFNSKEIVIYETPIATQPQKILKCDDNNDGFYNFDLSQQDNTVLNGQDSSIFEVIYYASMANYTANMPISDKISYENSVAYGQQTIIASVFNKNNSVCEDTTSFTIQVFETPTPNQTVQNLFFCDDMSVGTDEDGFIKFDLTQRESDILTGQSITDFGVSYFRDGLYLNEIIDPTAFENTSSTQTIYVKVENINNTDCIGKTSFLVEVFELPIVTSLVELKQCDDDIDGFSVFNLEEVIDEITTNAANEIITFHETQTDAENDNNPITNDTTYTNQIVSTDTVWARVVNANDCFRITQVNLIVSTTQIPLNFSTRNFYECDDSVDGDSTDGISSFDFSTVNTEIESLFPSGQQLIINYFRNLADALSESNAIGDISNYRNIGYTTTQNIYIRVDSKLDNDCLGLGSHITLHVEEVPIANHITVTDQCDDDGDGMYAFDTSTYESNIIGSQTNVKVSYQDENGIQLPSPLPNPFLTVTQTITVHIENALSLDVDGACYDETTISFSVEAAAVAYPIDDLIECDDDTDGLFPFDTSLIETTVLNGQTGMIVTYKDSNGDILPSPFPNPYITGSEIITVRVENPLNSVCYDETSFEFTVNERPAFELIEEDVICVNESSSLEIETFNSNGNYSYNWTGPNGFTGLGSPIIINEGGIYSVIATSIEGCQSLPKQIVIKESELANITLKDIEIVDDSNQNSISISTNNLGFGDYEYSLDNEYGEYQDEPLFNNITVGIHTVYIRDKNNCGTSEIEISVIGFPNFFTPNDDGENDYWNIKGINDNFYASSIIQVYDRFGKIVANVDPLSIGWNGYYNGSQLPASDYWFTVQLKNSEGTVRSRKGHFSLIRR